MYPGDDQQFEEHVISRVTKCPDGWSMTMGSLGFFCPDRGVEPKIGSLVRLYGRGMGYDVRGLFVDGRKVFYRTEAEENDRFARGDGTIQNMWDRLAEAARRVLKFNQPEDRALLETCLRLHTEYPVRKETR